MPDVHILHGRNSVDLEERVAQIRESLDPGGYATSVHDLDTVTQADLTAILSTPPFFGTTRVAILRGMPGGDRTAGIGWNEVEDLVIGAPTSTAVILASPQKIPANRRVLKIAKERGWNVETFDIPYGQTLVRWVQERAKCEGAAMTPDGARALLDRLYPTAWQREDRWNPQPVSLRMIATEVEKLTTAAGAGGIDAGLVGALVMDRSGVTAFRLNDEMFEGRADAALVELDNVLASGEVPERVIAQIGYQPLVLLAANQLQSYGPDAASEAAGISSAQLNATVGRKTAWRYRRAIHGAIEELRRAEWLVKSGRAPGSAVVLPALVGEIAGRFRSESVRRTSAGD